MPLFIPITKVDIAQRLVHGTLSEEIADKAGEILDYESSKPAFQEWSQQFHEASGGKSLGNVRAMHGNVAAGKLTDIFFDDENKRIEGVAKVVDDDAWNKVLEGVYTGFSIGGGYMRRWPDPQNSALMRYTPTLSEVSLVDNPAVPTATFSVIKQDGSTELRHFSAAHSSTTMKKTKFSASTLQEGLNWLKQQNLDDDIIEHIDALLGYLNQDTEIPEGKMIKKGLQETIDQLSKRIAALEAQPMPARGALKALSKSQDYAAEGFTENLSQLSPAERTHELIKIALANPHAF
jgi:hypothetical protein